MSMTAFNRMPRYNLPNVAPQSELEARVYQNQRVHDLVRMMTFAVMRGETLRSGSPLVATLAHTLQTLFPGINPDNLNAARRLFDGNNPPDSRTFMRVAFGGGGPVQNGRGQIVNLPVDNVNNGPVAPVVNQPRANQPPVPPVHVDNEDDELADIERVRANQPPPVVQVPQEPHPDDEMLAEMEAQANQPPPVVQGPHPDDEMLAEMEAQANQPAAPQEPPPWVADARNGVQEFLNNMPGANFVLPVIGSMPGIGPLVNNFLGNQPQPPVAEQVDPAVLQVNGGIANGVQEFLNNMPGANFVLPAIGAIPGVGPFLNQFMPQQVGQEVNGGVVNGVNQGL